MPLPEIEHTLNKFKETEEEIEKTLNEINKRQEAPGESPKFDSKFPSLAEAKERNRAIVKDLEVVKGNLRSKAIFSPTELQWERICKRYQEEPSLPITTWRCNQPVFV